MKNSIYLFLAISILTLTGCSDNDDPKPEQPIDSRTGYYFDGTVRLTDLQNNKPVYEIVGLLAMIPNAYGYDIHIPTPNEYCSIEVSLPGCNIETKNAVEWEADGKTVTADFPEEGTTVYNKALSITRNSDTSFTIAFNPSATITPDVPNSSTLNTNFCIYTNPKLTHAWTDTENGTEWVLNEDELATVKFPKKTGIRLYPFSFSDSYRPYWQPHLKAL